MTVLSVLAASAVSIMTATPLKLNPPFRRPDGDREPQIVNRMKSGILVTRPKNPARASPLYHETGVAIALSLRSSQTWLFQAW